MRDNGSNFLPPDLAPVLILMTDHHMGNLIIALPVIHALQGHFGAAVDVMVDERYAPLAGLLPRVGRVIAYPAQGTKRRGIVANLRPAMLTLSMPRRGYRAVIDIGGGTRATTVVAATLAQHRIGFREFPRSWIYSRRITRSPAVHAYDAYARILECIGVDEIPLPLRLRAPAAAHDALEARLREKQPDARAPIAVIHPGAGKEYRQWPAERFAAVADELVKRRGMNICIIGGSGDQPLMDQIIGLMQHRAAAFSLVLPIERLLALMERATILLSNESGPTHLAAATELPIATIFGPSKEEVWRPIRRENTLVLRGAECDPRCGKRRCYADRKCLLSLAPEMMLGAAEQLLSQPPVPVRWANESHLDTTAETDPALNC